MLFINHNDARRDAGAVKQVGWQTNNAFDIALLPIRFSRIFASALPRKQYAVGQDHPRLCRYFFRLLMICNKKHNRRFFRREYPTEAFKRIFSASARWSVFYWKKAGSPRQNRRLSVCRSPSFHCGSLKAYCPARFSRWHCYAESCSSRASAMVALSISGQNRQSAPGFIIHFQQQRTRTTGWVINRCILRGIGSNAPITFAGIRDTSLGVKLSFTLTGFGCRK